MMSNIFSMFDPSSLMCHSSWLMFAIPTMMLGMQKFKLQGLTKVQNLATEKMSSEFKHILMSNKKGAIHTLTSTFYLVLTMNLAALYPALPAVTAHISVIFPLSLCMWATIFMMGWTSKTMHALIHLVPQGSPTPLMNFMVLIELTSSLIRPLTLSIRLVANMIAGHLLMNLLSETLLQISPPTKSILMPLSVSLTTLETAVAFIQAYVFSTLLTLYMSET